MNCSCSTKAIKERDDKERSGKEKKEKKEKTQGSTPENKVDRREKQRDERAAKEERVVREGKEKTPKADREKAKAEEKSSKDDKVKAISGESAELSRDVLKEPKSKEKGDRSAVTGTLKSPVPRAESAESERGKNLIPLPMI